jgi:hypothetical protein
MEWIKNQLPWGLSSERDMYLDKDFVKYNGGVFLKKHIESEVIPTSREFIIDMWNSCARKLDARHSNSVFFVNEAGFILFERVLSENMLYVSRVAVFDTLMNMTYGKCSFEQKYHSVCHEIKEAMRKTECKSLFISLK